MTDKEFWEWCGFEYLRKGSHDKFHLLDAIRYPDGCIYSIQPVSDLNNLFLWAEEPLVVHFIESTSSEEEYRKAYYGFLCRWLKDYIWNEPHDPAIALRKAIEEIAEALR